MRRVRAESVTMVHVVGQGWARLDKAANGFATATISTVTSITVGNPGTWYFAGGACKHLPGGGFSWEDGAYPHTTMHLPALYFGTHA